jgi:hypothetical protein
MFNKKVMCLLKAAYLIGIETWISFKYPKRCFTFWKKESENVGYYFCWILGNVFKLTSMVVLGVIVNISFSRYHEAEDFVDSVIKENCLDA